jgi:phosphate transport system permease protein
MNRMRQGPSTSETITGLAETAAHRRWREIKDRLARYGVVVGGFGVITALVLIFVYLFSVVVPLFEPAQVERSTEYPAPGGEGDTLYLVLEEQNEVGTRVLRDGRVVFFRVSDGAVQREERLPLETTSSRTVTQLQAVTVPAAPGSPASPGVRNVPREVTVTETVQHKIVALAEVDAHRGVLSVALDDGSVLPFRLSYPVTYPGGRKTVGAELAFPYGTQPLPVTDSALRTLSVRDGDDQFLVAAALDSGGVILRKFSKQTSLIDETATLEPAEPVVVQTPVEPRFVLVNPLQEWLYVADLRGKLAYYDIRNPAEPKLLQTTNLLGGHAELKDMTFLAGGFSLVAAGSDGRLVQWFPVRDQQNKYHLRRVREFRPRHAGQGGFTLLSSELSRRGFLTGSADGSLGIYYATSGRVVLEEKIADKALRHLTLSPRTSMLLAETEGNRMLAYHVRNEHPEVSWSALWGKVWYEGYPRADFNWQSTAATNDFEPKLSLAPLTYGTIKGAFYAMLFAMPLAILGAIYTATFMSPRMRQSVKPTIEVMQALPTVVLGFLAGLWLAPLVEEDLPGVFGIMLLLPLVLVLAGFGWSRLPLAIRQRVPDGWEAALLVPVVMLLGWLCFALGKPLEVAAFGGNLPAWLDQTLGIGYDQRNCLVVGLAMGVAVIPTIFSISEDAIFGVPRHLTNGSLALGATPWQTVIGVVLPTASPGIFSALMIGLGRAVGETMIVLMATGNTPVMDFSMFSGMRTLSANVAVEMPESEVGSTHFRVLFLAALVLFVFTFVLNTLAEIVRQRLREKYSNI